MTIDKDEHWRNVIEPLMLDAKKFLDIKEREFIEQSMRRGYHAEDAQEAWFAAMCSLTAPQA